MGCVDPTDGYAKFHFARPEWPNRPNRPTSASRTQRSWSESTLLHVLSWNASNSRCRSTTTSWSESQHARPS